MVCSTRKSTVTTQCPICLHEGPAFRELIGQKCRCKVCDHVFQMPRHVSIACPGCGVALRVPAEMLDRQVACKFCNEPFRAWASLARIAQAVPGEHPALRLSCDPLDTQDDREIHQELEASRAELSRMAEERTRHVERVLSLEQALLQVVSEQQELRGALERLRAENQSLSEHERLDVNSLRAELKRVEAERRWVASEQGRACTSPHLPGAGSQPLHQIHNGHNGNRRVLSTRPPQRTAVGIGKSGSNGDLANLRDAIDRISHCESKADQLVAQLKTAQQDKEMVRQAFETVLVRLQDALSRARSEFDVAHGNAGDTDDRLVNPPE
jgi:DNA repair exonuclease SbcCD ATPase subunit